MPGFGFSLGFRSSSNQGGTASSGDAGLPAVAPHSAWDGTAGSGFVTTPTDPARTTAKPALRLITPPWQWFTDEVVVGVVAAANDGGSLFNNLGLERVVAHYEGNAVAILSPSYRTFNDVNGIARTYLGWWITLKHNGTNGAANLYFEAVPHDATMQRRVIGPYHYQPNASIYTHEIEIAPTPAEIVGARYKTLRNAMAFLRTVPGKINPLFTITEALPPDGWAGHEFGYNVANITAGWLHVTATVPQVFAKTPGKAFFDALANGMHIFGSNITFDFKDMNEITFAAGWHGHGHWLDGINVINSDGNFDLFEKRTRNAFAQLVRGAVALDERRPWFTECNFTAVWNACTFANLARGGRWFDCWGDIFSNTLAIVGTEVEAWKSNKYRTLLPAMTVTYSGGEPSATIAISQPALFNNRVVTARWGASSATFTLLNTSAGFAAGTNYSISNVVDWINTLPGWGATLLDDSRLAAAIVRDAINLSGDFPAVSVKGTVLTLNTAFDVHGDWLQQQNSGATPFENVYAEGNRCFDGNGQIILLGGSSSARDVVVFNNAWALEDNSFALGIATQFSRPNSHVVYVHNTLLDQLILFRGDVFYSADAYCLFADNVVADMDWITQSDPNLTIKDNHFQATGEAPEFATGTTTGGSKVTLTVNALAGDFTPAGQLLDNLKPSVVQFDLARNARGTMAAAGAAR